MIQLSFKSFSINLLIAILFIIIFNGCAQKVRTNKPCEELQAGDDIYIKSRSQHWPRIYHIHEVSTEGYEGWVDYDHYYKPETRPAFGKVMFLAKEYRRDYFMENKSAWMGNVIQILEEGYPSGSFYERNLYEGWIEVDLSENLNKGFVLIDRTDKNKLKGKRINNLTYMRIEDLTCQESFSSFEELE